MYKQSFEKEFKALFNAKLKGRIVKQETEEVPVGCAYNTDREKPWGVPHTQF